MFGTPSRTMMQGGTPGSAKSRSRHGIATRSSIISSGRKTPHGYVKHLRESGLGYFIKFYNE